MTVIAPETLPRDALELVRGAAIGHDEALEDQQSLERARKGILFHFQLAYDLSRARSKVIPANGDGLTEVSFILRNKDNTNRPDERIQVIVDKENNVVAGVCQTDFGDAYRGEHATRLVTSTRLSEYDLVK